MAQNSALRTVDLEKTYEDTGDRALQEVSMEVEGDEIVSIIGPSGAGKSTFIRCINRLVEPTGGEVWIGGDEVTAMSKSDLKGARREMGFIFQEFNLVERLTVMENVLSGRLGYLSTWRALRRDFPQEDVDYAYEVLERVGMAGFENNRADELSGGQRQRVGIARAVIQRPEILLVDEPTSSLDPETSREVMGLLTDIAADYDIPVLINIHEVNLAVDYVDRVVGLRNGQVVWEGEPDELDEQARDTIYRGEAIPNAGNTTTESERGLEDDDSTQTETVSQFEANR